MADVQALDRFVFATDDLGASGDNSTVFTAYMPLQVVEVGIEITTDLVPGGTSVEVCEFDITVPATGGVTGSKSTGAARQASSFSLTTSSSNVTHEASTFLSEKCDFTMEKGDTLTVQMTGTPTSGNGEPYIIFRYRGQLAKEPVEQRGGEAAE